MSKIMSLTLFMIIVLAGITIPWTAGQVFATQQSFISRLTGSAEVPSQDTNATSSFQQKFIAKLTGSAEIPPKYTKATGSFQMNLSPDGKISNYVLNVANLAGVTSAHIHEGAKNISGPILFTLYKSTSPNSVTNGILSKGQISSKHFEGPFAGKFISDLMNLINDGKAYVNVHTKQAPQGEIRGQLLNSTSRT